MNKSIPLVITCALKPQIKVYLTDIDERLKQYKKSIDDWCKSKTFYKIVIIDNTNSEILSNTEINSYKNNGIELEQISFGPEHEVSFRGSSWGTARIYEKAIESSKHIENSKHFASTTGRTFVKNAKTLLKDFDEINLSKTYVNKWLSKGYKHFNPGRADLRFVIWNKDFFIKHVSTVTKFLNDKNDIWIENIYNEIFDKHSDQIRSFSSLPRVVGQAGHEGGNYDGTYFYKWFIKNILIKVTKLNKY